MPDVDAAFEQAGGFGAFQFCMLAIVGFTWFTGAWCFVMPVFHAATPERIVTHCPEITILETTCTVGKLLAEEEGCDSDVEVGTPKEGGLIWEYVHPLDTVTAEWGLICDRRNLVPFVGSLLFFGVLVGNILLGPVPDRIGRCRTFCICAWLSAGSCAVCAMSQTLTMYLAARFCIGVSWSVLGSVAWVIGCEVVGKIYTVNVMVVLNLMWAAGCIMLVPAVIVLPPWRQVVWVHTAMYALNGIAGLVAISLRLESPPWLAGRGRTDEFHAVMSFIARWNGRSYHETKPQVSMLSTVSAAANTESNRRVQSQSFASVFCICPLARYTAAFAVGFSSCSLGYFGLSLNVGNLGGNVHVSSIFAALAEIPAVLLARILAETPHVGRRGTVAVGIAVSAFCCIASTTMRAASPMLCLVATIGKGFVTVSYCTIFIHAAEVYPAVVRGFATSLFGAASRVTGIISPMLVQLPPPLPLFLIGIWLAASILPMLTLPETLVVEATNDRASG
eukprot:gnl/TRDRNA2_/TRDRNA2_193382_c0_seq1.p1 gnl/TRDRNA2_/TRDRNA2_193382_c0~~gnl/TRDRNA2_/TRDRNA2_193382_c0_seq1.p1  ORF type:complete len:536 (+),score=50.46 gnl/TRDRNA2_/TRDRNA2_193382_c0_seq1:95-1609(+)